MAWEIRQGDVLERLREMPEQSVHCVVCSPPYWGLRDYQLEAQVWSGNLDCQHEWSEELPGHPRGNRGSGSKKAYSGDDVRLSTRGTCCACGAWRGQLGLEPTPQLYIKHLVEIFGEVWRVLRDDGTLWLNLGDSYCSHRENNGLKRKDLCMMPARVAFALQGAGW